MEIVYIETSVVSHATARPSRIPAVSVLQQQARDWWARERDKYSLVTSQLVLDEASLGDPVAVAERLKLLAGIPSSRLTQGSRRSPAHWSHAP